MKKLTIKTLILILSISTLLTGGCVAETLEGEEPALPTVTSAPKVVIQEFTPTICDVGVDKIYFTELRVSLENEGDLQVTICKLVIASNTGQLEGDIYTTLEPREKKTISSSFFSPGREINKGIGVEEVTVTVRVLGYQGQSGDIKEEVLGEGKFTISVPIARIGDTITEYQGKHDLPLTLLWWEESDIAVDGPYVSGYYTFTARPGMKFIILAYEFMNNGMREQETPYLSAGEIATTPKGYCYQVFHPPLGVHSEEYNPRRATAEEVKTLIGDSGGYERLWPEESVIGCVVFEIPKDATPIEASIVYLPLLVRFQSGT
ncbi:hypothetical protein ES708_32956 [subsurface metagenome]